MALPGGQNELSSIALTAPFLHPDGLVVSPTQDYELGGVALNDPSQGLQVQTWTCFVDGDNIMIQAGDDTAEVLFTASGVDEVALAFDQNMRPTVAYRQAGVCKLRWFDTSVGQLVTDDFPNIDNIRLCLDDKRPTQEQANDVLMFYVRNNNLYFRQQRDRFEIERLLREDLPDGRLLRVGMNRILRVQLEFAEGADPADQVWPVVGDVWEVPFDSGFSAGEIVGLWAEGFGFMGFRQIEAQGEFLVINFAPPGVANQDLPTELVIGYPYRARFDALPFAEPDGRGPIMGRKRRLIRTIVSVEDAAALLVNDIPLLPATGEGQGRELTKRTGEFEVRTLGWTDSDEVVIEAVSPYDATIRAMLREYTDGR